MRIILTVHQFLPDYYSGTEILTFETARAFQRLGHDVVVFAGHPNLQGLPEDQRFDSYNHEGIRVQRFHQDFVPLGGQAPSTDWEFNNPRFGSYFERYLQEQRPDWVHIFHLARLSASVIDVCHRLQVPVTMSPTDFWLICPTCILLLPDKSMCQGPDVSGINCMRHMFSIHHGPGRNAKLKKVPDWLLTLMIGLMKSGIFDRYWFGPSIRALVGRRGHLRQRMNLLDKVVVPTRLMERMLVQNGLQPEKVVFSPYGINRDNTQASTRGRREGRLRVGYIGILGEHKGVHILIGAIRRLPQSEPLDVKIYGKLQEYPAYVAGLQQLAAGDPRISFCGTFPNREIGGVLSSLDVLVVPSVWFENAPLVIYSALASGCPVIASNLGGMMEIIEHGRNGLLFPAGDAHALSMCLHRLMHEAGLLQELSSNVRPPRTAAQYAQDLLGIYAQILQSRPSRLT